VILVWDVGGGAIGGFTRWRDFDAMRDLMNEKLKEFDKLAFAEGADQCCHVINGALKGIVDPALDLLKRKKGTDLSKVKNKIKFELDKAKKDFENCIENAARGKKKKTQGGAEHTCGARGSTQDRHTEGLSRKQLDFHGEKGDARRQQGQK
jgi:hypothetical protein